MTPFIRDATFANSLELPSVHYAEEHALFALQAARDTRVDDLTLELPQTWPVAHLAALVGQVHPGLGVILQVAEEARTMTVPCFAGAAESEVREVCLVEAALPVVPDSMLTLLRLAFDPSSPFKPRTHFVDAAPAAGSNRDEDAADRLVSVDPAAAQVEGLESWWRSRAGHFASVVGDNDVFDHRNWVMAARRRRIVMADPGRVVLHVGGASHTAPQAELMETDLLDPGEAAPLVRPERFVACTLGGPETHLLGWSDVPCGAEQFLRSVEAGRPAFDRRAVIDRLFEKTFARAGRRMSPRAAGTWRSFYARLLLAEARHAGRLDDHLLASCEAAVQSPTLSAALWESATTFTLGASGTEIPEGTVIPGASGEFYIEAGGRTYLLRKPVGGSFAYRRTMFVRLNGSDRVRTKGPRRLTGYVTSPHSEERLLAALADEARQLADRLAGRDDRRDEARRFQGAGVWGTVHVRRTIWAWARGRDDVYLRRRADAPTEDPASPDSAVVFLLHPSEALSRAPTCDFWLDEATSTRVYANFLFFGDRDGSYNGLRENRVAIRVRLYRKHPATYGREEIAALLAELRSRRPDLCTVRPADDPLLDFARDPASLAVATAVRWTIGGLVTVVRDAGTSVGEAVLEFARDRGVRIVCVSPGQFRDPYVFDRFAIDTEVPTTGPFEAPEPTDVRRARPVPGFDVEGKAW